MADNKKYYYLKLKENFYDSEELIILQNMQDGYLYSDILMKLYLRSLKNNGKLMFKDVIPYTPSALAQVVRHQVGTVEKALNIFQQLGLIEVLDNGAIYMSDIQNFIGKSSTEADRKRQYREKIQSEIKAIGQMPDKCPDKNPPEIEKEIEIEIEKELELDKEKKIASADAFDYFENNIGLLTGISLEKLTQFQKELPNELIKHAIDKAVLNNARTPNYVFSILNDWVNKGIKNMLMVKEEEQKFKQSTLNNQEQELDYFGRPIKKE